METVSRNRNMMKDSSIERIKRTSIFLSIRNSFNLTDKDAIALAIIRQLADSLPADLHAMTPEQAEEAIRKRLGSGIDIKDVIEAISSWTENGMVYKHISIPTWIKHILLGDPMPSCLTTMDSPLSEAAGYLEMDSRIASVIKHAISSMTPIMLRIETKLGLEDLYIFRNHLAEHGISAFILDGPSHSSDEIQYPELCMHITTMG